MTFFPQFEMIEELPQASRLGSKLRALAHEGIYFGTTSWKYEGWLGSIYRSERYMTRGKFSTKKFETECLSEYAETFPTVCGDFAFYQFPTAEQWARVFQATPDSFRFAFKVPEDITVARWPGHDRYGTRAGQKNPHFLDEKLFQTHFVRPLERYASRVATLIFEFGAFSRSLFPTPADFFRQLDPFLASLPDHFRYCVEVRNPEFLGPAYFSILENRRVAHVLNAWTRMPELSEQMEMPGAFAADHIVVRAILARGRSYEQAVKEFGPYDIAREVNASTRDALRRIARQAKRWKKPAYLFVNNRLEGNAPTTIEAVVDALGSSS